MLTNEIIEGIVAQVREGTPPVTAAATCGVTRRNFNNWMNWARNSIIAEEDSQYRTLLEKIEKARGDYLASVIARGNQILKNNMFVSVKDVVLWLERQDPENWRRRESHEIVGTIETKNSTERLTNPDDEDKRLGKTLAFLEQQGMIPRPLREEVIDGEFSELPSRSEDRGMDEVSEDDDANGESEIDSDAVSENDEVHPAPSMAEASDLPKSD